MHRRDKRMPWVGEGYVDINPVDAKELGIEDGDYVWIDADPSRPSRSAAGRTSPRTTRCTARKCAPGTTGACSGAWRGPGSTCTWRPTARWRATRKRRQAGAQPADRLSGDVPLRQPPIRHPRLAAPDLPDRDDGPQGILRPGDRQGLRRRTSTAPSARPRSPSSRSPRPRTAARRAWPLEPGQARATGPATPRKRWRRT